MNDNKSIRVLFCCTGVGIYNRGIESFFRDAFDGLKDAMPGITCRLIKGSGFEDDRERVAKCLPRTNAMAALVGRIISRDSYVTEQLSSLPSVITQIQDFRPDVVFTSEASLCFQLYALKKWIRVPYRLLFSNGGPCHPPFKRMDYVHQVAPLYYQEAIASGEDTNKHFMVPYGINLISPPINSVEIIRDLRKRLGFPIGRKVILSVGWISREHKRMDYVIEEVARMPEPRPFLQLLGAMDEKSSEIVSLGNRLLGLNNFSAKSVSYEKVGDYYQAADCFVLGSLKEGFGRVYLEAMMHGLPTIAHQHPVMEYVLKNEGVLADLSKNGNLSKILGEILKVQNSESIKCRRWESVRDRFSWPILAPLYTKMFKKAAGIS